MTRAPEIQRAAPAEEPGATMIAELWAELAERYADDPSAPEPKGEVDDLQLHELEPPHGVFLIVSGADGELACGGVRRHDDGVGEIKRMYVRTTARGKGAGRALLAALEAEARQLGYHALVLETGLRQPEAIALYESAAYEVIPNYGFYKDSDLSRCYRKEL